ncbi:MerR family transcriptional regulator [Micromonospora sp. NPDC000018]|uniref:MerR family transcriptional regulator n=1 Tax=Micromonospora sp. NPDC000018 TaxID=3154239 RepID=UPI00331725F3
MARTADLDIGEVAERTGLTASALRFYERRGLIQSNGRNGLRRTFDRDVIDRIALISCAQAAGFTLAQIARFLVASPDDAELRRRMTEKARQLDQDITRLTRMRDSLSHAASCTHTPLVDCPEFKSRMSDGDAAG